MLKFSMWYSTYCLLVTCSVFIQAKTECDEFEDNSYESPYFDSAYSYLYLKLEEALINDQKTLDSLKLVSLVWEKTVPLTLKIYILR